MSVVTWTTADRPPLQLAGWLAGRKFPESLIPVHGRRILAMPILAASARGSR